MLGAPLRSRTLADATSLWAWGATGLAASAALGLTILITALARTFAQAPRLAPAPEAGEPLPPTSLTVVVPAYNEAHNIGPCLTSLLRSEPPCSDWRVLVADDGSTDATAALAQAAADA